MAKVKIVRLPIKIKRGAEYRMAYWDIDSGKPGPCLLLTAALHGNEVQGSEIIKRFCPLAQAKLIQGRMLLVPFANPLAVRNRRPHIVSTLAYPKGPEVSRLINGRRVLGPDPRANINCIWPGNPNGNEAEQITHQLLNAIVVQATHGIDLHCWNRFWATAALPKNEKSHLDFAAAGGFPFIMPSPVPPADAKPPPTCILSDLFYRTGRLALSVEFSGQYAIFEKEVRLGVSALVNCSKYLGMFNGRPVPPKVPSVYRDASSETATVTAPGNGLFAESGFLPGDFVKKGDLLGSLFDDRTLKTVAIRAPLGGRLYAYGHHRKLCDVDLADMHPYADKGDNLAIIVKPGFACVGRKKTRLTAGGWRRRRGLRQHSDSVG